MLGPPSPHTLAVASLPQLAESQRAPPCGDHWPGGMQHICPAREVAMWNFPLFSLLVPYRETCGSSASSLTVTVGVACSSVGSSTGAASSIDTSVGVGSSVGSSVGAASSVDTSAGVSSLVGSSISCGMGSLPIPVPGYPLPPW